ncbi:hypothetical protein OK016_18640 [Vibrio chagasii]|nr:hypothetical protein [Vibrio chagasii]
MASTASLDEQRLKKHYTRQLTSLAEHDFSKQSELLALELQVITSKLNTVVDSTADSIRLVTRNCETLYQTASKSRHTCDKPT